MPTRGVAFVATFMAVDSTTGRPKTGDSANITPRLCKDGTAAALTTVAVTEVDATNLKGLYKVSISATEADCDELVVGGVSATTGIDIYPTPYGMERLPNAVPGATNGVAIVGSKMDLVDDPNATALAAIGTAVWATTTRTLSSFGTLISDVWAYATRTITDKTGFALTSAYDPAKTAAQAGNKMDLVDSPNATALTAIGAKLEAMMLDEGDATALLAAIAAKVEQFIDNDGDASATLAAIGAAVNAAITAAHGSGSYVRNTEPTTPPTVVQIRQEMDDHSTRLASIDGKTTNLPVDPAADSTITDLIPARFLMTDGRVWAINEDGNPITSPSVDDIASRLLLNAANKLATGDDGSVTATVSVDEEAIAAAVVAALAETGVAVDEESQAAIAAAVAASLSGGTMTLVSAVSRDGGTVTLCQGSTYADADSTAVAWLDIQGTFPDWSGASVQLRLTNEGSRQTINGTIVTGTGSTRAVRFDISAEITSQLTPSSRGSFQVVVTLSNGHVTPPILSGRLVVVEKAGLA